MKTARKNHTGAPDCSCTSCLYKSASDNPSLGRFIAQGSRIDRLYFGKYIPLRERKLLERLVRTRAVYDDIRAKLISDSTISLSTKADSNSKIKSSLKDLDDNEKGSGAIFELVNLVDKGATLGLSECCSCCSCSSKVHFHDHTAIKHHRPNLSSRRQKERLDAHRKKKDVRFKAKHIRSEPCTCTFKFSGLLKNNKKGLVKKDMPMELLHLQSITNVERPPKQKRIREFARRSYENIKQSNKQLGEKVFEGIKKVKDSKTNIQERLQFDTQASAIKLKQTTNKLKSKVKTAPPKKLSKANLQLNDLLAICMCPEDQIFERSSKESLLDIYKQKSKEKIIEVKSKLKSAMKSTMERKPKITKMKTKALGNYCTCPDKDIAFQVKKDSIRKFQEELRRKQIMKDWECDPECIEDTCVPEECFIKLKRKRQNMKHRGLEHQVRKHEKRTGTVLNQKNEKIHNKALTVHAKNTTQKRTVRKKDIKLNSKQTTASPKKKSSLRQGVRIKSSFSFDVEFFKEKPKMASKESAIPKSTPSGINYKIAKKPKGYNRHRNSQVIKKHSSRDTQTEKRSLKRCFCTLKFKSKKTKAKHKKKQAITTDHSITTIEPVAPCKHVNCSVNMCEKMVCEKLVAKKLSNVHTNTANKLKKKRDVKPRKLLPYECEPGVCTPGNCDPYQCIKLINIREGKVKERSSNCFCPSRKTKSTSTFTSRSNKASRAKIAQSLYTYGMTQKRIERKPKIERKNVHNAYGRQAVKIGSTFSFNIEFYKNKPLQHYSQPSDLKTFTVKPKIKEITKPKLKERAYQGDVASIHKNMPTQIYKKERDESLSTSLKKCFCTLKLQRKSHSKLKKKKMFSTGTKTIEEPLINIITSTKGTKTKQKHVKSLKPYECEPFTCIPGECNPYECLERINRRNLRDVGVSSTFNRSDINKGSSTSEKSLKAVKTQSKPRYREQKVLTKVKKPKRQTQTLKEKVSYTSSARSKQAVRVGSSFSFNIEFFKNQSPMKDLKTNYDMRPAVKLDTRPITKNKGVKIVKLNVANLDTQVEEVKKRDKTTKPLLKRCFCTLNLQKRKNNAKTSPLVSSVMQSKVYTVNTALVKQDRLSIFRTNCTKNISLSKGANININSSLNGQLSDCVIKSLYNEYRRLNTIKHLESQSCCPLITNTDKLESIKSNFNTALKLISQSFIKLSGIENSQLIKDSNNINPYSTHINKERKCVVYTSNFNGEKRHLSGLGQYLKGYFCTMNLQVVRNKYTEKQRNIHSDVGNQSSNRPRKLKPYECEPGVCVPGECDPYECLKLISKRDSNFSKKTGTESTVTSTSSYTSHSPKYKSYKVQSPSQKTTKPHVTRVYQDQQKLGDKKAVRVGSTFSFDIEFSKKSASPVKQTKLSSVTKPSYPKKTKKYLSKNTGINKHNFRNQQSQSAFSKTLQKASATLPRMKRCFCTLKLQKKGRIQKERYMQPSEGIQTEAIIPQTTTIDRGQKAPRFKPLKVAPLEPHECPPGICTPGQCNPYQCLEIMKKLNYNQTADSGTDATIGVSKSSASMTISDQKHKTKKVYAKPRTTTKSNLSEGRQKRIFQPTKLSNPNKQVVRIGSSFSFDIEFHKSQPSLDNTTDYVPKKPPGRFTHRMSDLRKRQIKIKQRSSETSTAKRQRAKQSQIRSTVQAASTMTTSFMKRCFCVLKLKKNKKNIIETNTIDTKTIDTNTINTNVVKNVSKPVNMDKKTNTKHYKERMLQLEPYECEPGICIPGECDPYFCEKIIRRRNNMRTKSSSTAFNSTRSASSGSPTTYTKNINTQFRTNKTTRETEKQVYTKTKVRDSNRQVVKIGSNFSFDIEFYKNKISTLKDYDIPKYKKKEMLHSREKNKKVKSSGTKGPSVSFKSQISQMKVNKRDFTAGINNVIKRCFCTLQLYNQRSRKDKKSKESKKRHIKNEVHSKSVMTTEKKKINLDSLDPYECEPNICIPYECDPYECEKLIKLRQRKQHQRETGMSTQHSSKQSSASSTEPFKRSKKRTQSISLKTKEKIKRVKSFNRIQDAKSKQCVKIGSSFSFNVEFFKNKNAGGVQLDQKPQYRQPKMSAQKLYKARKTKTQALQSQNPKHSSPSQIENQFMKTQSTMARVTPPLKRCFCTFYLKKPKKEPVSIPKPIMSDVSTETKLRGSKMQPVTKLLPYECEPYTCIPGECNPLECLERIKARQKQRKNKGTSTQHLQRNEFGNSMAGTKTRNRTSQFKSLSHVKHKQQKQQKLITNHPNKQAVRIGSNFSFNIDFYKQRGGLDHFDRPVSDVHKQKYVSKPLNKTYKNKQVNKKLYHNMQQNRGSQSRCPKQCSKSSAAEPFLKRCFCTLKLQKKPATKTTKSTLKSDQNNIQEVSRPKILSKDKGTLTKRYKNKVELLPYECEPFTCIPGECDPYECQKRIEARNLKFKNISTQILKPFSEKSVGMNLANLNSKKIQSHPLSNLPNKSKVSQSNIVETPRFGNLFNKQAVKIGSNFSFNIEFYKEILPPTAETYSECNKIKCYEETRPKKPKKYTDSITTSTKAKHHNKGIQGYGLKTDNKASEVGNALKRCFCTLKLQKELNTKLSKSNIQNPQFPQTIEVRRVSVKKNTKGTFTEVKSIGTKTKEKYLKATGCDPQTCPNFKILGPQEMKVIHPYTPSKFNKTPSKTMQNKDIHNNTNTKPRKTKLTNRGKRLTKKKSKNPIHSNQRLGKDINLSHNSLSNIQKFMCKCAQLFGHKTDSKKILNNTDAQQQQLNNKNENESSKKKRNKKAHKTEPQKIHNNPDTQQQQLNNKNENEGSKNKKKKIAHKAEPKKNINVPDPQQQLNNKNENETFKNKKNKIAHKTEPKKIPNVPDTQQQQLNNKNENKGSKNKKNKIAHKTEQKKNVNIPDTQQQLNNKNENESSVNKKKKNMDKNKIKKRDEYRNDSEQKKYKSVNLKHKHTRECNENCPYINSNVSSPYQAGDVSQNPTMSLKMVKKHQMNNTVDATPQRKQNIVKESVHQKDSENTKKTHLSKELSNEAERFFCTHCSENMKMNKRHSQPLKVHFRDTSTPTKYNDVGKKAKAKDGLALLNKSVDQIDKHRKSIQNNKIKTDIQSRKLAKYCKYCTTCGAKLNHEDIKKAAGDQKSLKSEAKEKTPSQNLQVMQTKVDKKRNLFGFKKSVDNVCSAKGPEPPLFEMHLDSDDYEIINKEEVIKEVKKLKKNTEKDKPKDHKPHDASCRCCICIAKRYKNGATINVSPKGIKAGEKPCVCGSEVCAEELIKMAEETHTSKSKRAKRCYCGSRICAMETKTINAIADSKDNLTCICAQERKKLQKKLRAQALVLEKKNRAKRLKKYEAEDKIRIAKRQKKNKQLEKKLNKNGSDMILLADSLIDIGKFGITACTDILRLVARQAIDPKHAYHNLKEIKENPDILSNLCKKGIKDSGLSSTCKRVRLRCLSMQGIKTIKGVLEQYAFTNYLLYIFHKDPRKRILKRRRQREQLDFNCSLYMGSLRKRPYLSVYNKYPWFYPHFLSLLNVWKQFMEIALFLLAVVVWSPCIFCMEACRACMCCFFCTG